MICYELETLLDEDMVESGEELVQSLKSDFVFDPDFLTHKF